MVGTWARWWGRGRGGGDVGEVVGTWCAGRQRGVERRNVVVGRGQGYENSDGKIDETRPPNVSLRLVPVKLRVLGRPPMVNTTEGEEGSRVGEKSWGQMPRSTPQHPVRGRTRSSRRSGSSMVSVGERSGKEDEGNRRETGKAPVGLSNSHEAQLSRVALRLNIGPDHLTNQPGPPRRLTRR